MTYANEYFNRPAPAPGAPPSKRIDYDHRPPNLRFAELAETTSLDQVHRLERTGTHSPHAVVDLAGFAEELAGLFASNYPARAVELFLAADESFEGRCDRWSALHTFELMTGAKPRISPWPGWRPDNPDLRSRHLRPLEIGFVRLLAVKRMQVAATIGFCDAGVGPGELAGILNRHICFDDGAPVAVELPKAKTPRTVAIPTWCRRAITHMHFANDPDASLLYTGTATRPDKIQSCLLMRINWALHRAGLWEPNPDKQDPLAKLVKPISVRNGAGRERYDAGEGIEAIAGQWGLPNLTITQRHLGLIAPTPRRTKTPNHTDNRSISNDRVAP